MLDEKVKTITLEQLEKETPLQFTAQEITANSDTKYVVCVRMKEGVPREAYPDIFQYMKSTFNNFNIDALIINMDSFESLDIYEIKGENHVDA